MHYDCFENMRLTKGHTITSCNYSALPAKTGNNYVGKIFINYNTPSLEVIQSSVNLAYRKQMGLYILIHVSALLVDNL